MRILALDLATKTGWAFWDGVRIESGMQDFSKSRGESNGILFMRFNRWLMEVAGVDGGCEPAVDLIVYEQPHHRGGYATEIAVGLSTRVQEFCAAGAIEHAGVHSATIKKYCTGRGNADKAAMLWQASIMVGGNVTDDNEGDALCLLRYAMEKLGGAGPWNARSASPEARSSKQENITP